MADPAATAAAAATVGALLCRPALDRPPVERDGIVHLRALPQGHVLLALVAVTPDAGPAAPPAVVALGDGSPHAVRRLGPGQWLVVGPDALPAAAVRHKAQSVAGIAALSDQSHGRVPLAVEGPRAADVLNRGAGLDLSEAAFPVGQSAQTLFGGIGLHITRTAPQRFELLVLRSYAGSLWDELAAVAAVV